MGSEASNLPHRVEALHDTVEFDIFNPPLQDRLDNTDTYLSIGADVDG